ncbi:hypothetical protein SAMN05216257_10494 [Meinhardsimonia xiamenensis]|jgi:hypothetical protein|uniref:GpW protein n=1 Tax=Meinhardsimonia xiamenensis TaxID=990712 RepID=A0A1G9DZY9_9RHOB|nr:hypothetical protein [Meinhardsimonia xiamenensis]PRX29013.1 hypothetical protein LV81_02957 [Meinhardsimonia xiamenensis]SDK69442.1 hypothetical protein SAMN05216257_10494 [Meinhardsimonia xiamenensis]
MSGFSEEELEALRRAYASGTLTVKTGEHQVTYGSAADLLARIRYIEQRLASASGPAAVAGFASFRRPR